MIIFVIIGGIGIIGSLIHMVFFEEDDEGELQSPTDATTDLVNTVGLVRTGHHYQSNGGSLSDKEDSFQEWEDDIDILDDHLGEVEESLNFPDGPFVDDMSGIHEDFPNPEMAMDTDTGFNHPEHDLSEPQNPYDEPGASIMIDIDYFGTVDDPLDMVDDYGMDSFDDFGGSYDDYGSMDFGFDDHSDY